MSSEEITFSIEGGKYLLPCERCDEMFMTYKYDRVCPECLRKEKDLEKQMEFDFGE